MVIEKLIHLIRFIVIQALVSFCVALVFAPTVNEVFGNYYFIEMWLILTILRTNNIKEI